MMGGGGKDWSREYLTLIVTEPGTITWEKKSSGASSKSIKASINGGEFISHSTSASDTSIGDFVAGDEIRISGTSRTYGSSSSGNGFGGTAVFDVAGDLMSMCTGVPGSGTGINDGTYNFRNLFSMSKVRSAENLVLPPDTTAACYYNMFRECSQLIAAPRLPAAVLSSNCYYGMFFQCTALQMPPEIMATTLAQYCFNNMFRGCSALLEGPELPVTTLAYSCYQGMFEECGSLKKAPALPARVPADSCYSSMFRNCTYIDKITCLLESFGSNSVTGWTYGVSDSGIFTKAAGVNWPTGANGIPTGWMVIEV